MNTPQEFAALRAGLRELRAQNQDLALVTLLRTHGPAFRRAGARMLVAADGRIVRGLSAGCPEADIAGRAREAIREARARVLRYDREHAYDTLLEMGCGGELEVLIEPLHEAEPAFVRAVAGCMEARRDGLLATAWARDGECLPQPLHLVQSGDVLLDEFDDPPLRDAVLSLRVSPAEARARVERIDTQTGSVDVLIEALQPPLAAVLIGLNATSRALARLGATLGWQVRVIDHREPAGTEAGIEIVQAAPQQLLERLHFDARTVAVVMTHNLERDLDYLHALRAAPLAYLGALGSRTRATRMREACGATAAPLHAPAGLDIGSETPEEIALAIGAEIQAVLAGRDGASLSTSRRPIHGTDASP